MCCGLLYPVQLRRTQGSSFPERRLPGRVARWQPGVSEHLAPRRGCDLGLPHRPRRRCFQHGSLAAPPQPGIWVVSLVGLRGPMPAHPWALLFLWVSPQRRGPGSSLAPTSHLPLRAVGTLTGSRPPSRPRGLAPAGVKPLPHQPWPPPSSEPPMLLPGRLPSPALVPGAPALPPSLPQATGLHSAWAPGNRA